MSAGILRSQTPVRVGAQHIAPARCGSAVRAYVGFFFVIGLTLAGLPGLAEESCQRVVLKPGWNAVYMEVQPLDTSCDTVFSEIPVKSVWAWNKRFSPMQYVQDPNTLVPDDPEWLTYFPPSDRRAFLSDLHAVHGGRCYLIELGGELDAMLEVRGKPVVRDVDWVPNSFNLVGFHVDSASPPTFAAFFAPEKALQDKPIYRVSQDGRSEAIMAPAAERMRPGEAFWVYCEGECAYQGPLELGFDHLDGLEFGAQIEEQDLRLKNSSGKDKQVTIELLSSDLRQAKSLSGELTDVAGSVPLSYHRLLKWSPLSEPLTFTLPAGSEQALPLAVRRAAMPAPGSSGDVYQSILVVRDDSGMRYRVPVSAARSGTDAGLWAGNVVLTAVSEAANPENPDVPTPATSEFSFRIMVHVDEEGQARLLQHVTLMQVQATYVPDPDDPNVMIEDTPARYVLITRDDLLGAYTGVSLRDGKVVGRRITSPVFGFTQPVALTGDFNENLQGTVMMDYDDPLNPFVHRFHPDHNNFDERYENILPEGKESFSFSRTVRLEFTEQDPEQLGLPEWGYALVGGIYHESLSGVHQNDIHVRGTFRLNKVVEVAVLNDGQ